MQGVQSFVAQRQQTQPNPSRQVLGAQHRVQIPPTKLDNTKQKLLFQKPDSDLPAGCPVVEHNKQVSRQKSSESSAAQDGFDTDAEGFDETITTSVGGSTRGHHGEEEARNPIFGRYDADAANNVVSGAQVSFQRGQEQPYHAHTIMHLHADASEADENEEDEEEERQGGKRSNGGSEDEMGGAEEERVHDDILQELNSPGFSRYLQGETSYTAKAAFAPFSATSLVLSGLALRDAAQHLQKPVNPLTSRENSLDGGASDSGMNLRCTNTQAHVRTGKQTPAVPFQKVPGLSLEQPSILAQHYKVSHRHESSQQPTVMAPQILQPMSRAPVGIAVKIGSTNGQLQADEERSSSMQTELIEASDNDFSSIERDPNIDIGDDRQPAVSARGLQTRKRTRDLDYSPDQLSSMTFQQLSSEPFSLTSDTPWPSIPQELSSGTLAAKMDYVLEKMINDNAKYVQRSAFFSSLPIEQYEECANLMIRRFSDIVSKFTDARQQRRQLAKDFEEETAEREERVRGKTSTVDQDLSRLKRGGEEVVRGA